MWYVRYVWGRLTEKDGLVVRSILVLEVFGFFLLGENVEFSMSLVRVRSEFLVVANRWGEIGLYVCFF